MDQGKSHENLREYARELETNLDVLAEFADAKFSSVRGGAKDFPRPAPESRAAEQGFDVLRRDIEEAVGALYALAKAQDAAREDDELNVPPALFGSVQPFIDAFDEAAEQEGQGVSGNGPTQTEGDATTSDDTPT
jgi:hypothetical protein